MSVIDAAKRLALRQDGGVSGLAGRMGINASTFAHKLAGQEGFNLFLREAEAMTLHTNDPEIAQAFAFLCGHVCIPVIADAAAGELGGDIAAVGREFGELMAATQEAIKDGHVTARELAEYDRQFQEFLEMAVRLRAHLKAKIPAPPGIRAVVK